MITYDRQLDDELQQLIEQHPYNFVKVLLSKGKKKTSKDNSQLRDYVMQCVNALTSQSSFKYKWKTLVYWALNHIQSWDDERVKCKMCGKSLLGIDVKHALSGYARLTCSRKCERKLAQQHNEQHLQQQYGIDNVFQLPEVQAKLDAKKKQMQMHRDATKRKNKTFKASKQEDIVYEMLCKKFTVNNVIRQYYSDVYPFNCDFYIKSIDTYIECNFSWTHGGHWFDENNEEDQKTLQTWKEKKTKYYDNAIYTWTVRDMKKRKCAEKNKLKYVVLWKFNENIIDNIL